VQKERKFVHVIRVPKLTRTASAVAAAALIAAAGILAGATVASAAPHPKLDPTKLSISNKAIAHGKHHADAVSGVLTSDGAGLASETVTLQDRTGVKPRWTVVATGTTATGGTVSFTVTPKVKTQYELVFAGDSTYQGSQSNVITLRPVK
jgi:hypothetical protein